MLGVRRGSGQMRQPDPAGAQKPSYFLIEKYEVTTCLRLTNSRWSVPKCQEKCQEVFLFWAKKKMFVQDTWSENCRFYHNFYNWIFRNIVFFLLGPRPCCTSTATIYILFQYPFQIRLFSICTMTADEQKGKFSWCVCCQVPRKRSIMFCFLCFILRTIHD